MTTNNGKWFGIIGKDKIERNFLASEHTHTHDHDPIYLTIHSTPTTTKRRPAKWTRNFVDCLGHYDHHHDHELNVVDHHMNQKQRLYLHNDKFNCAVDKLFNYTIIEILHFIDEILTKSKNGTYNKFKDDNDAQLQLDWNEKRPSHIFDLIMMGFVNLRSKVGASQTQNEMKFELTIDTETRNKKEISIKLI